MRLVPQKGRKQLQPELLPAQLGQGGIGGGRYLAILAYPS